MATEEGLGGRLFFFNYNEDTRKVTCGASDISSLDDLVPLFTNKYSDKSVPSADIEFWTTDKTYGVRHRIEGPGDIYDGAVIEVVNENAGSNQKRGRDDTYQDQGMKRSRTTGPRFVMRLRGLPWESSPADIEEFFEGVELVEFKIIFLPSGRASGEAVVEVANQEEFDKAMKKSGNNIGSRYIEIFKSTGQDMDKAMGRMQPGGPEGGVSNPNNSVIRMRGIPFSALESDVIEFFAQVGVEPARVHLIREDGIGRPSGQAYVEFTTQEAAQTAMGCNRKNIGSRYIELFRAEE